MAGPCSTFTCRLYRDGLQTPWGFRLQGGKDFNQPLTVQRVFTGSPAEGELQRGDVIIKINNTDVSQLAHKEAQDIIKTPAGQLVLNIQRGQTRFSPVKSMQQPSFQQPAAPSGFRSVPFESSGPKPYGPPSGGMKPTTNFAVDYNVGRVGSPTRRPEQSMINRVHDSLNEAIAAHQSGEHEDDYNYGTVTDRKKLFSQDIRAPVVHSPGRPSKTGKAWRPPQQFANERPKEFGWSPSKPAQPGYRAGPPTHERAYSPPRQAPAPAKRAPVTTHLPSGDGSMPAWKGTLYGAGQSSGPPLQAPAPSGGGDKEMDYTKSYAWQMIKQESASSGGPSHQAPSHPAPTDDAHHDTKQSRSFRALENAVGASDF